MKESYSLDLEAYRRIFSGCSLPVTLIAANPGLMGGGKADEFIRPNDTGEGTFMICNTCGYAANKQINEPEKKFILAPVRGDLEVGETKLQKTLYGRLS